MSGIFRNLRGYVPQHVVLPVVLVVVGLCYWRPIAASLFGRPQYPSQWDRIHRGMTREEVITVAGDDFFDNEIKGFLLWSHKLNERGVRWDLNVFFDGDKRVRSADVQYVDPVCGDVWRSVTIVAQE